MDKIESLFNKSKKREIDSDTGLYKWEKPAFKKDDVGQLNRLLKRFFGLKGARVHSETAGRVNSHFSSRESAFNKKQKVITKTSYGFSLRKHADYLSKYMPQLNKNDVIEKPELFGSDLDEYKTKMVAKHYKIVISPENQNVDLEILTKYFIKKLEELSGYELLWEAAIHNDTGHRHVHLAINGVDKKLQRVSFTSETIKEKMRTIVCDAVTNMIGERTHEEIKADKEKLPFAPRWTKLDERLTNYKSKILSSMLDTSLQQRLSYLYKITLATKEGNVYTLAPGWQETLKKFGRYNTFMDEYLNRNGNITLYKGGNLEGVVEKTYSFDKDESWNDAIIVKTRDSFVYVPVYNLQKDNLEGKTIQINMLHYEPMKKISDREIKVIRKDRSHNIRNEY